MSAKSLASIEGYFYAIFYDKKHAKNQYTSIIPTITPLNGLPIKSCYNIYMRKYIPDDTILVPRNAELVFSGKVFDVYQWPQELFDGTTKPLRCLNVRIQLKSLP